MNKKFFKQLIEKLIEGVLTISGGITSLAVLLIVIFLFREGLGLFHRSTLQDNMVLAVNPSNPLNRIKGAQVKEIFDQNVTNWKQVGGKNDSIIIVRVEDLPNYFTEAQLGANFENLAPCISHLADSLSGVILFVPQKYITTAFKGKVLPEENVGVVDFFTGKEWYPTAVPASQFGVLPLIMGTLWVSIGAILFALPLGLAVAIYLAEIADPKIRRTVKPLIELLSGIPSVIYGFFGLVVLVPLIQKLFNLPVGETALAGCLILGIMALPTIITIAEDAMRTTPRSMKEASLALGASRWQTISRIVIPYSISGITAAAILGIGRAIGETMAVLMVTGNAGVMPHTLLQPVRTIPATIAAELGESPQGGIHYQALFVLGCVLFIITLLINLGVEYVSSKRKI